MGAPKGVPSRVLLRGSKTSPLAPVALETLSAKAERTDNGKVATNVRMAIASGLFDELPLLVLASEDNDDEVSSSAS